MRAIPVTTDVTRLGVVLNLDGLLPQVLGMLADAYGEEPAEIGQLLMDLATARNNLSDAQQGMEQRNTPDCVIQHAGGAVDAAHAALMEAAVTEFVTVTLTHREALELASDVTESAARTSAGQMRSAA